MEIQKASRNGHACPGCFKIKHYKRLLKKFGGLCWKPKKWRRPGKVLKSKSFAVRQKLTEAALAEEINSGKTRIKQSKIFCKYPKEPKIICTTTIWGNFTLAAANSGC